MMRWRWLISPLLLMLLGGCGQELPALKNGTPAPAFVLEQLDGHRIHFPQQHQNQVIALRFWADWCPYCYNEMQALEPVYRQYRDQGLVILAINVMQSPETAKKFVEKLGISYQTLLDRDGEVMRRYQVTGLPMTFIIDRNGLIRSRIAGESTPAVFIQAIEGLF